ncbi:hypothetical protein CEXT_370111 [Caerostris extrusa]|uniref:Uncharacterized protein n=1 Tax=Caerostris extrusa TaxID=172846 RepID=A0AAV4NDC2_CAEEX|nr:hypothetical protein CEXT_370111 [Caerostris extrusa]
MQVPCCSFSDGVSESGQLTAHGKRIELCHCYGVDLAVYLYTCAAISWRAGSLPACPPIGRRLYPPFDVFPFPFDLRSHLFLFPPLGVSA